MNDFDVKETTANSCAVGSEDRPITGSYNMTDVLSLPPISAQACPLTMTRENSVLTKRLSYSENLKDRRSSLQFSKSNYDGSIDDNKLEAKLILSGLQNQRTQLRCSKSLQIETQRKSNSRACQQILARIQRKFTNKSLRKGTNKTCITDISSTKEIYCKKRHKQHLTVSMLFKNDSSRKENQSNSYEKNNKKNKQCPHVKDTKKSIDEEYRIETKNSDPTYQCGIDKGIRPKENPVLVGKSFEVLKSFDIPARQCKKVYYSERQSVNVDEVPGVPPCTPNEMISCGIASLSDIKSQRRIQQKLLGIQNKQRKKEKEILESAKAKEIQQNIAKKKELMETQRRQIYAINKILADIENEKFLNYKTENSGVPV